MLFLIQVLSAQLGRKPEDIIKLDANENPYGPPPEVLTIFSYINNIDVVSNIFFHNRALLAVSLNLPLV